MFRFVALLGVLSSSSCAEEKFACDPWNGTKEPISILVTDDGLIWSSGTGIHDAAFLTGIGRAIAYASDDRLYFYYPFYSEFQMIKPAAGSYPITSNTKCTKVQ